MKQMTVSETIKLVKEGSKPSISIYLRTDHKESNGTLKIKSRLQRLYKSIEDLISRTYDGKTKDRLLRPLKASLDSMRIKPSRGGVAIYHREDFTGIVKLPVPPRDLAVAAESYHLKPLLRCMQLSRRYFLLAIRKKCADLYMVSPDGVRRMDRIPLFDTSDDAVTHPESPRKAWFKSGLKVIKYKQVLNEMEVLNRHLEGYWLGERVPLVLAGSSRCQNAFRESCRYMYLINRSLAPEIDHLPQESLIEMANQFMEQYFAKLDELSVVTFRKAKASGLATSDLREICDAASKGQIQSLLIAEDRHLWGHLDRESGRVRLLAQKLEASSDDVLDDLAELTLMKGGQVTVLPSEQMPEGVPACAVMRWRTVNPLAPADVSLNPRSVLHQRQVVSMQISA